MTRILSAVVGLCLAAVLAACAATPASNGAAPRGTLTKPDPASLSSKANALPHSGAPSVADPLPESALPSDPCQAFTRPQIVEALGEDAPEGERDDIATGPWCSWQDSATGAAVFVNYITATREGLSNLYRNTKPGAAVWREIASIGGFPAVAFKTHEDESSCSVTVGIADEYTVAVVLAPSRAKQGDVDACALSERMAGTLVDNLRARAGR
ncbi:DUF3558 domain-containing protein [Saccharomonospora xinjiangensis]|uniref:DUF3558 domain-containing protein n=1 Tax=Saccharomonospora xinjiangensis TaxID=75294 RepID=UPI00106F6EB9|nr:DUF3558 domain-containing protein [Saccharomonospora xinjiangensis]QBQ62277.1 hypothetical protein EYD13_19695 [Saccharomonospora xinjiangensis]